jgi:hypothetical protein
MSPIQAQLDREARWDVNVACVGLVLFFVCCLVLPRWTFWWWFTPMAAFWFRYLIVRDRRDASLLSAEIAASGGGCPAGCYASEAGICLSDGTHQVLIPREQPKAPLQLPHIVGDK